MDTTAYLVRFTTPRIVAPMLALLATLSFHADLTSAADSFQSSCKSTCGTGAACQRLAKQTLAACAFERSGSACQTTYAGTRLACRAEVDRCRTYCRSCAAESADQLASCRTAGDPVGCAAGVVATFFRCLRDGSTSDCAPDGLATPDEIAQSPRPDGEAEMLAIEASGSLVAPPAVYARIRDDLALIRAQRSEVQGIEVDPGLVPEDVLLTFDDAGRAAVAAGTYTAWDCANDRYDVVAIEHAPAFTVLHFAHRFNTPVLAAVYKALPHVLSAEPNAIYGDGNDVCAATNGETYSYVFDLGSGDCPAGCIDHTYFGFSTSGAAGQLTSLGTWSRRDGDPPPWFTRLAACTKWL